MASWNHDATASTNDKDCPQRKEYSTINAALQSAVEVGEAEGCSTIVLGAQTSVLSQNATTLLANKSNTTISSGNTFTTAAALHNISRQVDIQSIKSIAVVGALGNIGSAIVRYLALFCSDFRGSLHLYGRRNSETRLEKLKDELCKQSQVTIGIETDLLTARSRELIIIAISSNAPILSSEHFDPGDKCIVADISQPPAITEKLHAERPNLKILEPAMITLPNDPGFQLSAHSKPGEIFACAAEGIVSALTPHNHDWWRDFR